MWQALLQGLSYELLGLLLCADLSQQLWRYSYTGRNSYNVWSQPMQSALLLLLWIKCRLPNHTMRCDTRSEPKQSVKMTRVRLTMQVLHSATKIIRTSIAIRRTMLTLFMTVQFDSVLNMWNLSGTTKCLFNNPSDLHSLCDIMSKSHQMVTNAQRMHYFLSLFDYCLVIIWFRKSTVP